MQALIRSLCALFIVTVASIVTPTLAADSGCEPDWMPSFDGRSGTYGLFTTPPFLGESGDIYALTTFDDGSGRGPELYAGGLFTIAGGSIAHSVARWDGKGWRPLGTGVELGGSSSTKVFALAVFDDGQGGGPALYAGGLFVKAGGLPAAYIARWNGQEWSAVGGGTNDAVLSLAVFDDGSGAGPALYAGGAFTLAGGVSTSRIAKWDGRSWSPLSSGVNSSVFALKMFDDGSGAGPKLIAAGDFTSAGGAPASRVASWGGTTWTALGAGVGSSAFALEVVHDGTQSRLYVGGAFVVAGGQPASRIASWDGRSWSSLGTGVSGPAVRALHTSEADGRPPVLIVGGMFALAGGAPANSIAQWDGSAWSTLEQGVEKYSSQNGPPVVYALASMNGPEASEPLTYVGGRFDTAGGEVATNFAVWDGASWPIMPSGIVDTVLALAVPIDESANSKELIVGGHLLGRFHTNGVARWDGGSWHALGSGFAGEIRALAFFNDGRGGGAALYAGGAFATAGGVPASGIARWDGSAWSPVGGGVNGAVFAMAVFDDGQGGGPALFVAGDFTTAGGVFAQRIARWDGNRWSPLAEGIGGPGEFCNAIHVHDDGLGHGPALYVGGAFSTAGATPASNIAKWDGVAWSALGSGTNDEVVALASFDDGQGQGPKLIAGGWFGAAGGVPSNFTAIWNGSGWEAMGTMSPSSEGVMSLAVMPDRFGGGSRLYAARGPMYLDVWDGATWTGVPQSPFGVFALHARPGTPSVPPSLVMGGTFSTSAAGDSWVARLVGCPSECPADLTFDGIVGQADLAVLLGAWGDSNGDLDGDGTTSSADLGELLGAWGDCPS